MDLLTRPALTRTKRSEVQRPGLRRIYDGGAVLAAARQRPDGGFPSPVRPDPRHGSMGGHVTG